MTAPDPTGEVVGDVVALVMAYLRGDTRGVELVLDSADDVRPLVLALTGIVADLGEVAVGEAAFRDMLRTWRPGRLLTLPE